jgi:hypothetical protein
MDGFNLIIYLFIYNLLNDMVSNYNYWHVQ